MTNKERLEVNNEKIETIMKILNDKILASSGADLIWTQLEDGSFRLEIVSK